MCLTCFLLCGTQPSSAGHRFVALTGFFVVYKFFRLTHNASAAALEEVGKSCAAVGVRRQSYCCILFFGLFWGFHYCTAGRAAILRQVLGAGATGQARGADAGELLLSVGHG